MPAVAYNRVLGPVSKYKLSNFNRFDIQLLKAGQSWSLKWLIQGDKNEIGRTADIGPIMVVGHDASLYSMFGLRLDLLTSWKVWLGVFNWRNHSESGAGESGSRDKAIFLTNAKTVQTVTLTTTSQLEKHGTQIRLFRLSSCLQRDCLRGYRIALQIPPGSSPPVPPLAIMLPPAGSIKQVIRPRNPVKSTKYYFTRGFMTFQVLSL